MTDQATHDECQMMAGPDEHHDRLKPFVGTWAAEVKMWMGPGEPSVSTGVMTNAFDLGGRFLTQTYKGDPSDGPFPDFEGRGYWGYNTVDKRYEGVWMDTASTMMMTEQGDVDASGKVWTMTGTMTNPEVGGPMAKKSVVTLVDDDHHTMEMYFDTPQGECKAMEIKYARTSK